MTVAQKKLEKAKKSAGRALDEGQEAARQAVGAGMAKIEETGGKLSEAGGKLRERAGAQLGGLRAEAEKTYAKTAKAVESGYGSARKSLAGMKDDVGTYVRDHTGAAISAVATVGLVVGFLLGRKNGGS